MLSDVTLKLHMSKKKCKLCFQELKITGQTSKALCPVAPIHALVENEKLCKTAVTQR